MFDGESRRRHCPSARRVIVTGEHVREPAYQDFGTSPRHYGEAVVTCHGGARKTLRDPRLRGHAAADAGASRRPRSTRRSAGVPRCWIAGDGIVGRRASGVVGPRLQPRAKRLGPLPGSRGEHADGCPARLGSHRVARHRLRDRAQILAFAFGIALPFIETNIRTVYLHEFFGDAVDVPDAAIMPLGRRR